MIAYIILNIVSFIYLSPVNSTTLVFPDPVEYAVVGDVGDAEVFMSSDRKTVTIKPLKEVVDYHNMVFKTKKDVFYFKFKTSAEHFSGFLNLKVGKKNISYKKIKDTETYTLLEGETSLMLINKSSNVVDVNGNNVTKSIVISKGVPVLLDGQIIN